MLIAFTNYLEYFLWLLGGSLPLGWVKHFYFFTEHCETCLPDVSFGVNDTGANEISLEASKNLLNASKGFPPKIL